MSRYTSCVLFFCVFIICGCGPHLPYKVVPIEGTLLYKGRPLERVSIIFEPIGEGRASTAMTGKDGHFVAEYTPQKNGVQVGKHNIILAFPSDEIHGIPKEFAEPNKKYGYGAQGKRYEIVIEKGNRNLIIDLP